MKCISCKKEYDAKLTECPHCGYSYDEPRTLTVTSQGKDQPVIPRPGLNLLDRFVLIEEVAKGGMGIVYKARDIELDETVALKILKDEYVTDEEMLARFKREIKIARRIRHANACSIYDLWISESIIFISMEFIEGKELTTYLEPKPLAADWVLQIISQILPALQSAHEVNIIHRDLKPSNIMITPEEKAVIMDFGIARYVGKSDLTSHDDILGTPNYMAPEQFKGQDIDQRCDIYSTGVILYEMITGSLPFFGESPLDVALKHIQEEPIPPREINPEMSEVLNNIIMKCMEKNPDNRYQTIAELMIAIDELQGVQTRKKEKKILIVDDEPAIISLLERFMKLKGLRTVSASNGGDAIQVATSELPDIILLDIMMPSMDGYHTIEIMRENKKLRDIPVIIMTSIHDKQYEAYAKKAGAKAFFLKPLDLEQVYQKIHAILNE